MISSAEALAFKRRWTAMNAAELRELRTTTLAQKARQTAALMEWAKKLGWLDKLDAQDKEVRGRWNEIRKAAAR
jgi:hypothetical protein